MIGLSPFPPSAGWGRREAVACRVIPLWQNGSMQESVLVSFAILNTNWEARHTSYIDNFVPFVSDCLRTSGSPAVSGVEVQACLRDRFGLQIPLHGVDADP